MQPSAIKIPLSWGNLAGLHWSRPGAPRALCLHGWLDNAASFIPLAGYLQNFDLLALDLAGHGLSAHRPEHSRYYFSEYLYDLDEAIDALGWDSCHLIGHSMGGGLASCFAATRPGRVQCLVLLDTVGMLSAPAGQATRQMRLSMLSVRKQRSNLKPYKSVADAVIARQGKSDLSNKVARLLCERSLEHTGEFFQWRTDPRLNWRSPQRMTEEQVLGMLGEIQAPTLAMSSPALAGFLGEDKLQRRFAAIARLQHEAVDGHHHFHMEQAQHTAKSITEFLQQQCSMPS